MTSVDHEQVFADIIGLIQDNHIQLMELQDTKSRKVVQQIANDLMQKNNQMYQTMSAIWEGMLELVRQRDTEVRNGTRQVETQIIRNIEYNLDVDHEQARVIYDFVTGQLTDWVWGELNADAKTALRQIAEDVSRDREEQYTGDEVA